MHLTTGFPHRSGKKPSLAFFLLFTPRKPCRFPGAVIAASCGGRLVPQSVTSNSSLRHVGWSILAIVVACLAATAAADDAAAIAGDAAAAAAARTVALGGTVSHDADGNVTGIAIPDGGGLTADDLALFGELPELSSLKILNCRALDDELIDALGDRAPLDTLAMTNSAITDTGVAALAKAFPQLEELDLSSNTNLTGAAMRSIASLEKLQLLSLVQTRFNDLHTRRLKSLENLEVLDLRGNMEAGDMTLGVVGGLPKLRAFKHRSTIVTDDGIARLAASENLAALLLQDFAITSAAGPHLAGCKKLASLEIFRCQGFGSPGVLALADLPLTRLTLRDLPQVGDDALAVLAQLPKLKRLALHELASVGDTGLAQLAAAENLQALDLWALPLVTDGSAAVIAALPALEEISIRETGITDAGMATILANEKLHSLTFRGDLSAITLVKISARKWKKLDIAR